MEDEEIVELYFARDERALTETARKYGGYCYHIANGILNSPEDADETVSDTWLRVWNSIPPQKPIFLKLFLAKITRNLAFSRWRSMNAAKRGGGETELALEELAECIPGREMVDDELNVKELGRAIRAFLDTIPEREQDIFLRRYFYAEDTISIALRYGMKNANVLRTLSRTRQKLKNYLTKEGYDL